MSSWGIRMELLWMGPYTMHTRTVTLATFHLLRISHIRNSVRVTFHFLRIFHILRLTPGGKGRRFNFPSQTYPDPPIALTRRVSQPFCTVLIVLARRVSQPFCKCRGVLLKLPDMCDRLFVIFCFRYLMSKFPICATDILRYFSLDI